MGVNMFLYEQTRCASKAGGFLLSPMSRIIVIIWVLACNRELINKVIILGTRPRIYCNGFGMRLLVGCYFFSLGLIRLFMRLIWVSK